MNLAKVNSIVFLGATLAACSGSQRSSLLDQQPPQVLSQPDNQQTDPLTVSEPTLHAIFSGNEVSDFQFSLDKTSLAEGNIEISIENSSKNASHDFIVTKMKNKELPIVMKPDNKSIDAVASKLVEQARVNKIKPGKFSKITLILREGYYFIYCASAGHYSAGESAILTVLKK